MSYTLPSKFASELAGFIADSITIAELHDISEPKFAKKLESLFKEFISAEVCPWPIKVARDSETLKTNSGKILVVVPKKGSVFVSQNDVNFPGLHEVVKKTVKTTHPDARVLSKISPSYGAGFTVCVSGPDDADKFFEALSSADEFNEKSIEVVRVDIQPRPENPHSKFMAEAHAKYPTNSLIENNELWNKSAEKKAHDAAKAKLDAERKAESERKKTEKKAESEAKKAAKKAEADAKKAAKPAPADKTKTVDPEATQVFPEAEATLVVPPKKTAVKTAAKK